jgi:hypothetical protein
VWSSFSYLVVIIYKLYTTYTGNDARRDGRKHPPEGYYSYYTYIQCIIVPTISPIYCRPLCVVVVLSHENAILTTFNCPCASEIAPSPPSDARLQVRHVAKSLEGLAIR